MTTVFICCNTLEDELNEILKESAQTNYEIIWIEAGLHDRPKILQEKLQQHLKEIKDVKRVIMALGHCGGACVGLITGDFELILPKADDCLSLLLGSIKARLKVSKENYTLFLTDGWLRQEESLIFAFKRDKEKFGEERAWKIYKIMLNHYKRFGFIETGFYNVEKAMEKIKPIASKLDIKLEKLEADLSWFQELLFGPWDDESKFLRLPPQTEIKPEDWDFLMDISN